jgi:hypothetical protein
MSERAGFVSFFNGFAAGAIGVVRSVANADPATPEVVASRLATCEDCPSGLYRNGICDRAGGGCGCYLRLKVRLASERCPKGHW